MKTKMIFIAIDGTEFTNEDECQEYETNLKLEQHNTDLHMWDIHRKPTTEISEVYYVKCDTMEACQLFDELSEQYGCMTPFAEFSMIVGELYFWDEDFNDWNRWSLGMIKYQDMGEFFQMNLDDVQDEGD